MATIELPVELIAEIDRVVGADQRTAFLIEAFESALRRRSLQQSLKDANTSVAGNDERLVESSDGN
jgi:hypothetical protein